MKHPLFVATLCSLVLATSPLCIPSGVKETKLEVQPRVYQKQEEEKALENDLFSEDSSRLEALLTKIESLEDKVGPETLQFYSTTLYETSLRQVAAALQINPNLAKALMARESNNQKYVVSSAGAYGPLQVTKIAFVDLFKVVFDPHRDYQKQRETTPYLQVLFYDAWGGSKVEAAYQLYRSGKEGKKLAKKRIKRYQKRAWKAAKQDPEMLMKIGVAYLARIFQRFDDQTIALAAYNAGPTFIKEKGFRPLAPEARFAYSVVQLKKRFDWLDAELQEYSQYNGKPNEEVPFVIRAYLKS